MVCFNNKIFKYVYNIHNNRDIKITYSKNQNKKILIINFLCKISVLKNNLS
jgi:hypothetical protein